MPAHHCPPPGQVGASTTSLPAMACSPRTGRLLAASRPMRLISLKTHENSQSELTSLPPGPRSNSTGRALTRQQRPIRLPRPGASPHPAARMSTWRETQRRLSGAESHRFTGLNWTEAGASCTKAHTPTGLPPVGHRTRLSYHHGPCKPALPTSTRNSPHLLRATRARSTSPRLTDIDSAVQIEDVIRAQAALGAVKVDRAPRWRAAGHLMGPRWANEPDQLI